MKNNLRNKRVPSGLRVAWKFWRHCCCRNGFYPLVVAPFITASFLLDVFCTVGCGYITLNVGFEPVNEAWKDEQLRFGLFNYQSGVEGANLNSYMNNFHPGCVGFNDLFKEFFVVGDKTWVMSQIMGIVSACAGCLSTIVIWLMVISPIPVCFLWPGVLLPASLVAFLGGAAKFLFFDIEICKSNLWLPEVPEGSEATPLTAESCTFGMDATLSIISSVTALACVLLVCLKAPKRKEFDDSKDMIHPGYDADIQNLRTYSMGDSVDSESVVSIDIEGQKSRSILNKKSAYDLNTIKEQSIHGHSIHGHSINGHSINGISINAHSTHGMTQDNGMTTIPLHRNPSSASDAVSIRSNRKAMKMKRKVNLESEMLRQAEPSIEYTDQELCQVMNVKANNTAIHLPQTPPLKPPSSKHSTIQDHPSQHHTSPFLKGGNFKRPHSNKFSPAAPSDESGFMLRSPLPHMTKCIDNNTSPGSSRRSTSSKKKNSSRKKSIESGKKTEQTSNKSQNYDEALIQKCVIDLQRSFSGDLLPRQSEQ